MRRARSRRLRRPHVEGRRTEDRRCATLEQRSRDLRECRGPRHGNARPAGMSHRLRLGASSREISSNAVRACVGRITRWALTWALTLTVVVDLDVAVAVEPVVDLDVDLRVRLVIGRGPAVASLEGQGARSTIGSTSTSPSRSRVLSTSSSTSRSRFPDRLQSSYSDTSYSDASYSNTSYSDTSYSRHDPGDTAASRTRPPSGRRRLPVCTHIDERNLLPSIAARAARMPLTGAPDRDD